MLALLSACSTRAPESSQQSQVRMEQRAQALQSALPAPDAALYSSELLAWVDADRKRNVAAKLYLPTKSSGPVPLVVFSHGIGGSREGYSYLGKFWAANGVAALHLQHEGSDRSVWVGNPLQMLNRLQSAAQETEAIDRAKDASFALSQVLANPIFAGKFDPQRIAAAGHSYGANTAMLLAGAQVEREQGMLNLRDPRIKAALLLSAPPFYGEFNADRIVANIQVPTLHITATADDIAIPGYNSGVKDREAIFKAMGSSQKTLAVFEGGSHSVFTDRLGTGGLDVNPKIKRATRELSLAFWHEVFQNANATGMKQVQQTNAPLLAKFVRVGA